MEPLEQKIQTHISEAQNESAQAPIRIAIVEDDPAVVAHFRDILKEDTGYVVTGVASNLTDAREILSDAPDLFLLDIGLPDGSGLDFIKEIKAACEAHILIVTSFGDRETIVTAIVLGADGYLLKDSETLAILDGIGLTIKGGSPISAAAAVYLLERLRQDDGTVEPDKRESHSLTPREVELLKLFSKGFRYREAAQILDISPLTVGSHVKSIYRKLAVNSRSEAVYEAVTQGLFDL